jgi:hypothetical protein
LAADQDVTYCRFAVVKLPTFVPRAVVKNQLRKAPGKAPMLVAWDARERATLPVTRDDVPYVLVFDAQGWLVALFEEEVSEAALDRVKTELAQAR